MTFFTAWDQLRTEMDGARELEQADAQTGKCPEATARWPLASSICWMA